MSSNLPPGVTEGMFPENDPETIDLEKLFDEMADDIAKYNLPLQVVRLIWCWIMRDRAEFKKRLDVHVGQHKVDWEMEHCGEIERAAEAGRAAMHAEWSQHIIGRVEGYLRCVRDMWNERGDVRVRKAIRRALLCARVVRHTMLTGPFMGKVAALLPGPKMRDYRNGIVE